jgi:uncharacterized protein YaaQ
VKLVLAVVQATDLEAVLRDLRELGAPATQIEGDGAVGRGGLAALMIGVSDEGVADILAVLQVRARGRSRPGEPLRPVGERAAFWLPGPVDQLAGGASVYVLPVRRYERFGYA